MVYASARSSRRRKHKPSPDRPRFTVSRYVQFILSCSFCPVPFLLFIFEHCFPSSHGLSLCTAAIPAIRAPAPVATPSPSLSTSPHEKPKAYPAGSHPVAITAWIPIHFHNGFAAIDVQIGEGPDARKLTAIVDTGSDSTWFARQSRAIEFCWDPQDIVFPLENACYDFTLPSDQKGLSSTHLANYLDGTYAVGTYLLKTLFESYGILPAFLNSSTRTDCCQQVASLRSNGFGSRLSTRLTPGRTCLV
jgi:hypothetical protein